MSQHPNVYIANHSASVLSSHKWRTASNSAGYLLPHLTPSMKILDVGCGPGTITIDLARHVPSGSVTGLEYSGEPLVEARATALAQDVANVTFVTGDVHDLSRYPAGSFDVAHAHQVLQHLSDPVRALREMARVVGPGGLVACREVADMLYHPRLPALDEFQAVYKEVASARGGNPYPGAYLHVWAREAGLAPRDRLVCSSGTWCYSTEEERRWWGGLWQGRLAEGEAFAENCLKGNHATREKLDEWVRAWGTWKDDPDGWFTVVHGEILFRK